MIDIFLVINLNYKNYATNINIFIFEFLTNKFNTDTLF